MILAHLPVCSLAVEGGFGLNFDLFESNIINLAIVIAGLVWFLPKVLGSVLERRRSAILNDLEEAEQRLQQANAALIVAQEDLANAQTKAERIRIDGVARADAIRLESEQRTVEEMARLKQSAVADLDSEAARVSDQLRREAARQAIERALSILPGKLDEQSQGLLVDRSIQTIGQG
ncbi:F0F1 ATP synthase subunit B [Synechococcus sp. CS-602]|uniref:F0F1 ATP synthase subunit B n=1 Tax=Synechococcaceae TaxID=1890426 RepID=UPI0008FF322A|nr:MULTISPECIES: F0F1 ATP synthase subunit B [Synechococcaceae]MCT4363607.1 F0F1 ATP synthase subunit B [Candidatus Regnicoccus frigidus MAG-AL1]APD48556.1 ATP F0F1 synthase subunit B [Synechococcus sp. SynAce01]MCT0203157.1 F0F1 ATP synthase subunit B [Synechococcus sp. CS-603]MCT0205364.1 F0F1 ATP synthase subunit B [Synechococcus sp. CS-602]MCT0246858.1 F0F1 ATP synthase subunit B [Synechococcus sp. CS-601]